MHLDFVHQSISRNQFRVTHSENSDERMHRDPRKMENVGGRKSELNAEEKMRKEKRRKKKRKEKGGRQEKNEDWSCWINWAEKTPHLSHWAKSFFTASESRKEATPLDRTSAGRRYTPNILGSANWRGGQKAGARARSGLEQLNRMSETRKRCASCRAATFTVSSCISGGILQAIADCDISWTMSAAQDTLSMANTIAACIRGLVMSSEARRVAKTPRSFSGRESEKAVSAAVISSELVFRFLCFLSGELLRLLSRFSPSVFGVESIAV